MNTYQQELKVKMNTLAHEVYKASKIFPRHERFGLTSQITRAALSVILNYIEGYARYTPKQRLHFLEIAFGSLKETQYLIHFVYTEQLLTKEQFDSLWKLADQIGAMLWTELDNLSESIPR